MGWIAHSSLVIFLSLSLLLIYVGNIISLNNEFHLHGLIFLRDHSLLQVGGRGVINVSLLVEALVQFGRGPRRHFSVHKL